MDKREKKYIDTLLIYTHWYKFQTILMPRGHKKSTPL